MSEKLCTKCGKPGRFYPDRRNRDGQQSQCATCCNAKSREQYRKHTAARKAYQKRRNYGITQEEILGLLGEQEGRCAICEIVLDLEGHGAKVLCVDHDHRTKQVRGLLCNLCNRGIGFLREDVSALERAITYLRRHGLRLVKKENG